MPRRRRAAPLASRWAGVSLRRTRNRLRVWSIPVCSVLSMPGADVWTAKRPVPSRSSASTSITSAAAASHTSSTAPRSATPSAVLDHARARTRQRTHRRNRGTVGDSGEKGSRQVAVHLEPGQRTGRPRRRWTAMARDAVRRPVPRRRCRLRPSSCRRRRIPGARAVRWRRVRPALATPPRSCPRVVEQRADMLGEWRLFRRESFERCRAARSARRSIRGS